MDIKNLFVRALNSPEAVLKRKEYLDMETAYCEIYKKMDEVISVAFNYTKPAPLPIQIVVNKVRNASPDPTEMRAHANGMLKALKFFVGKARQGNMTVYYTKEFLEEIDGPLPTKAQFIQSAKNFTSDLKKAFKAKNMLGIAIIATACTSLYAAFTANGNSRA